MHCQEQRNPPGRRVAWNFVQKKRGRRKGEGGGDRAVVWECNAFTAKAQDNIKKEERKFHRASTTTKTTRSRKRERITKECDYEYLCAGKCITFRDY